MNAWWEGLSLLGKVFLCAAVPATVVMVLQAVLLLFGLGDGDGADGDFGGLDLDGDPDMDLEPDLFGDGEIPEELPGDGAGEVSPQEAGSGLVLFTIRGIVAFFAVGGWAGFAAEQAGLPLAACLSIAAVSGAAALYAVAWMMQKMMGLQECGNWNRNDAIGKVGRVYLPIPEKGRGRGKVTLQLPSGFLELDAISTGPALPTGTQVAVCALADSSTLVVEPAAQTPSGGETLPGGEKN